LSCAVRRATSTSSWPWEANSCASAAPMPAEAPVINVTGLSAATSPRVELRDHLGGDRLGLDLGGVVRIRRRPHTSVEALHGEFAAVAQPVAHVEAGTAEFRHDRFDRHVVAELGGFQKA